MPRVVANNNHIAIDVHDHLLPEHPPDHDDHGEGPVHPATADDVVPDGVDDAPPNAPPAPPPPPEPHHEEEENGNFELNIQLNEEQWKLLKQLILPGAFLCVFILKALFNHFFALVILAVQYCLLWYGNRISPTMYGPILGLLIPAVYVFFNLLGGFDPHQLHRDLTLFTPAYEGFWTTTYYVLFTDFAAKHIVVLLKLPIHWIPRTLMRSWTRGKCFQHIEFSSRLYRCLLPISRWVVYLVDLTEDRSINSPSTAIRIPFFAVYMGLKVFELAIIAWTLVKVFTSLVKGLMSGYQTVRTQEECPICLLVPITGISLRCGHVFCEECVERWSQEHSTCPLCRAVIENVGDEGRNGVTSELVRLF